jgi:DNA-binding NarL/FixJ family response regulator
MATVILAQSQTLLRDGIRKFLVARTGVEIVGEVEDGPSAVRLAKDLAPDVLVMDQLLRGLNALDATLVLRRDVPKVRTIILLAAHDKQLAPLALAAGASGVVLTEEPLDVLAVAIESVLKRGRYMSAELAEIVLDDVVASHGGASPTRALSSRERQVLQLLAEGHTTRDAAEILHLSPRTIEAHRRRIVEKTGARSLAHLTKFAIRHGLTSVES